MARDINKVIPEILKDKVGIYVTIGSKSGSFTPEAAAPHLQHALNEATYERYAHLDTLLKPMKTYFISKKDIPVSKTSEIFILCDIGAHSGAYLQIQDLQ
jgi:hypothetical protein